MAIPPEEMWVIALGGVVQGLLRGLCSKDFMSKHHTWAAVASWPSKQLDRLGDWMYVRMPWLPFWPPRK